MKKIIKLVLLITAAVFLLLIGVGAIYYIPVFSMNPTKTDRIPNTDIYAIENVGNTVYFIRTENGYIMIDAGSSTKEIENSMKKARISIRDVKWILLTHSDGDHVAALTLFPNANICMSKEELPFVNGTRKRMFFMKNSLPSGVNVNQIIPLLDRQQLSINETIVKCLLAPGHTDGSMLYLVDNRYLFTGDAFKIKDGNIDVHPFSMNKELSKKTIEQMKTIINNSPIVLTSHYGLHYKN